MDPLLSMLQNAASRTPQPVQPQSSQPQSQNGPRPGSQTLDQLFASLTSPQSHPYSPPPPSQTSHIPPGRQAQLLGLLQGSSSTPEAASVTLPPTEGRAASPQEERAHQMLASLMGQISMPGTGQLAHPVPHTEPLINHSSSPTQPPGFTLPDASAATPSSSSPPPPPPPPPPPTQPSKFAFVSPFDAFDDIPPPPPPSQKKPVTQPAKKKSTPAVTKMASRHRSPVPSTVPQEQKQTEPTIRTTSRPATLQSSTTAERDGPRSEELPPPTPANMPVTGPASITSSPASTSAAVAKKSRKGAEVISMPYKAAQFVQTGRGNLIKTLSQRDVIFDVSKPNADSLAHEQVLVERKISAVKTDVMSSGLTKRRGLAISRTMVAYLLSKGGARILDQSTGLNTMITVEEQGQMRKIVDIGVVDGGWAAGVLDDHSFCIWKIDTGIDALNVKLIAKVLDTESYGPVQRVHWRQPTFSKEEYLIDDYGMLLATDKYVIAVGPEDYELEETGNYGDYDVDRQGIKKSIAIIEYGLPNKPVIDFNVNDESDLLAILQDGDTISMYMGTSRKGGWTLNLPSTSRPTGAQAATAITAIDTGRVLVEFDNGMCFALIDKTGQSLGSITFSVPTDGQAPSDIRQAAARYDAENEVVWISHFVRASLFAFRLAGVKAAVAFECFTEIPLEPLGDFALSPRSLTGNDDLEIFYKFPRGFSQTTLDHEFFKQICQKSAPEFAFAPEAPIELDEKTNETLSQEGQKEIPSPTRDDAAPSEVRPEVQAGVAGEHSPSQNQETTSTRDLEEEKPVIGQHSVSIKESSSSVATLSNTAEITAAMKKGEERVSDKFNKSLHRELSKQAEKQNAHVDSLIETLRSDNAEKHQHLTKSLETALTQAVQVQFDNSPLPHMEAIIRKAVSDIVVKQLVTSVEREINDIVVQQMERVIAPQLSRSISTTITPLVENQMQQALEQIVAPQFATAVQAISSDIGRSMKSEIINVHQSIAREQSTEAQQTRQTIQSMAATISLLADQVRALSTEVQALHSARPSEPPRSVAASQSTPKDVNHPPFNGSAPPIPTESMEDIFLAAFANMNNGQLMEFVCDKYADTLMYLPNPGEESPLSQAVLLTMIHRLSSCLRGNETGTKGFQACLSWVFRALRLIDRQDPATTAYLGPIFSAVRKQLLETIRTANMAPDAGAGHAVAAREIIGQVLTILA